MYVEVDSQECTAFSSPLIVEDLLHQHARARLLLGVATHINLNSIVQIIQRQSDHWY